MVTTKIYFAQTAQKCVIKMCIKTPIVFNAGHTHWWLREAHSLKLAPIGTACRLGFYIKVKKEFMSDVSHQAFHVLKLIVMQ